MKDGLSITQGAQQKDCFRGVSLKATFRFKTLEELVFCTAVGCDIDLSWPGAAL